MLVVVATEEGETRTIPAGEFKAKCLKLMDEVLETGVPIVITKRGRPVSRLMPPLPDSGGIVGLFPELKGLWDDPSDAVIEAEYSEALEAWGLYDGFGEEPGAGEDSLPDEPLAASGADPDALPDRDERDATKPRARHDVLASAVSPAPQTIRDATKPRARDEVLEADKPSPTGERSTA